MLDERSAEPPSLSTATTSSPPLGEGALRRDLGVLFAAAVVVNASIGTGIFRVPAKVARLAGSVPGALAL